MDLIFTAVLFLFFNRVGYAAEKPISLPSSILVQLDRNYPGWKLEKVSAGSNLVSGDFNDDGQQDYAAQIVYEDSARPLFERRRILAFIKSAKIYK